MAIAKVLAAAETLARIRRKTAGKNWWTLKNRTMQNCYLLRNVRTVTLARGKV
jgi:hypothetical protein